MIINVRAHHRFSSEILLDLLLLGYQPVLRGDLGNQPCSSAKFLRTACSEFLSASKLVMSVGCIQLRSKIIQIILILLALSLLIHIVCIGHLK